VPEVLVLKVPGCFCRRCSGSEAFVTLHRQHPRHVWHCTISTSGTSSTFSTTLLYRSEDAWAGLLLFS
jgi:hypothetical protein